MTLPAKIFGLVLSGGKSTRMGQDKGLISYHGTPQREHLYHLLAGLCERTFMSIRKNQVSELTTDYQFIVDTDAYKGPYNGLLSAYKAYPDAAWLVLACDLPLMDTSAISHLIVNRDSHKMATAFASVADPLPEPLCAIWEPEAMRSSLLFLEKGNGTCPRKFLIQNNVALVFPERPEVLLNANSTADYDAALLKIKQ